MKNILKLFIAVVLMGTVSFAGQAQEKKLHFGVTAGLNFQTLGSNDYKNNLGYKAGVAVQANLPAWFSIQPELLFHVKSAKLSKENMLGFGYLELPVNIQWGIDLMVAKPFIFASPYVGYCVSNKVLVNDKSSIVASVITDELAQNAKRFEYGVGVGLGCNIARFQITAKYSWNFGAISSSDWMQTLKSGTAQGLEVSVGLRF